MLLLLKLFQQNYLKPTGEFVVKVGAVGETIMGVMLYLPLFPSLEVDISLRPLWISHQLSFSSLMIYYWL
jgi:hypothetical protein